VHTVRFIGPGGPAARCPGTRRTWMAGGRHARLQRRPRDRGGRCRPVGDRHPDDVVAEVAAAVRPEPDTVVMHLSVRSDSTCSLPICAGGPAPLVPLPNATDGARRLTGASPSPSPVTRWPRPSPRRSAVGPSPWPTRTARPITPRVHRGQPRRGLLGQVERVAATAGLDLDAFLGLTRAALDDVARLGPVGPDRPAGRGDFATSPSP